MHMKSLTSTGLACRACSAKLRTVVVDLGVQPPCQTHPAQDDYTAAEVFYPLTAYLCDACFLMQVPEVIPPEALFDDYPYFSSYSTSWLAHAARFVEEATTRFGLGAKSRVVELASNDGYLLQNFVARGIPCLGVEPAANVAAASIERGVPTRVAFFGSLFAEELVAEAGPADLVVANNVLAHTPHLVDFVAGVARLLAPGGVASLEFPHLQRLIEGVQFDTIYHEHFSYFSLHVVRRLFAEAGLTVWDAQELNTHGGSLRVFASPAAGSPAPTERMQGVLRAEEDWGWNRPETYRGFGERVAAVKRELLTLLIDAAAAGRTTAGYGAAGKGAVLLNYCGVRSDLLPYVVDRNPHKQGRTMPGVRIPIHPVERLLADRPDEVLILPWNLEREIRAQIEEVADWPVRFIIPIPEPRFATPGPAPVTAP